MSDLIGEMVGHAPGLGNLVSQVAERSGGNPFFAEEIVRSLAESGGTGRRTRRVSPRTLGLARSGAASDRRSRD